MAASPLKKDGKEFHDMEDFKAQMGRMVPEYAVGRLADGWHKWGRSQADKWRAPAESQTIDQEALEVILKQPLK